MGETAIKKSFVNYNEDSKEELFHKGTIGVSLENGLGDIIKRLLCQKQVKKKTPSFNSRFLRYVDK